MKNSVAAEAALRIYEKIGKEGSLSPKGLDFPTGGELALSLGYPEDIVKEAGEGILGAFVGACPLPSFISSAAKGKTVADLGCGAGLDSFWLARMGAKVVSLDLCPAMVSRMAAAFALAGEQSLPVLGVMPEIPLKSQSFDFVLMNGSANIVAQKEELALEALRILKKGGVWLLADVVALGEIDEGLKESPEAWAFCVGGALSEDSWRKIISEAGFSRLEFTLLESFPPLGRALLKAVK